MLQGSSGVVDRINKSAPDLVQIKSKKIFGGQRISVVANRPTFIAIRRQFIDGSVSTLNGSDLEPIRADLIQQVFEIPPGNNLLVLKYP